MPTDTIVELKPIVYHDEGVTLESNEEELAHASPEHIRFLQISAMQRPEESLLRETYLKQDFMLHGIVNGEHKALQNIWTPSLLSEQLVQKLLSYFPDGVLTKNKTILVYNIEFLDVLFKYGILFNNRVWFVNENPYKVQYAKDIYKGDEDDQFIYANFLKWETIMKFDAVIMNPPYQTKSKSSDSKTQPLWDKFALKALDLLEPNGFLCAVHPSAWRKPNSDLFTTMTGKQIHYLEIHNEADGLKTFGATTRYDWYVLQNKQVTEKTNILGEDYKEHSFNLSEVNFIPNSLIETNFSFLAKHNEEKVNIIHSFSAYESRKPHMSKDKSEVFVYPVVYSTPIGEPTIWYSSTNQNGHFGIPKLILNPCRPIGCFLDEKGDYGMSQFCVGITGNIAYLKMVQSVFLNQKTNGFAEFMKSTHFTDKIFNKEVVSMFRKDFWKNFTNTNKET